MTVHKALHPRDDVDRLYTARKKGGRGLAGIEDSVDEKYEGGLITAIKNDIDNTTNRMVITRKQKWKEK